MDHAEFLFPRPMSFVGWASPTGTRMPKNEVQWEWLWPVPPRPVIPARSKRESILRFLRGDEKDRSPLKTARITDGAFSHHTEFWLLAMVRTPLRRGESHAINLAMEWDGIPQTLHSV